MIIYIILIRNQNLHIKTMNLPIPDFFMQDNFNQMKKGGG